MRDILWSQESISPFKMLTNCSRWTNFSLSHVYQLCETLRDLHDLWEMLLNILEFRHVYYWAKILAWDFLDANFRLARWAYDTSTSCVHVMLLQKRVLDFVFLVTTWCLFHVLLITLLTSHFLNITRPGELVSVSSKLLACKSMFLLTSLMRGFIAYMPDAIVSFWQYVYFKG